MNHTASSGPSGVGDSPLVSIILLIVVVGYIVYRQTTPRKLSVRSLIIFPLIVLFFLVEAIPSYHPSGKELVELGIDIVVTAVLGLLAARQLTVSANPATGRAEARGSWRYFLWWIAAFAFKAILAVAFDESARGGLSRVGVLVPLFFLLATRNAYLYWRASSLGLKLR